MRAAVIGVGSNSVRLLVADCQGGAYRAVLRDRRTVRLFSGLKAGALSEKSMHSACAAVCGMAGRARELGAEAVFAFATCAARDARNGERFRATLRDWAGLELDICSGEEEARLSYFGAARPGHCGLIDIGGGSTEWVIGRDGVPLAAVSLQIGAVRLCARQPIAAEAGLYAAIACARETLAGGLDAFAAVPRPPQWVGVGGAFAALAALDMRLHTFDPSRVEGYLLTGERTLHWARTLAGMPLEARKALPGMEPQRADIVVHGAAILLACFELLDTRSVIVSDLSNLDGYLRDRMRRALC